MGCRLLRAGACLTVGMCLGQRCFDSERTRFATSFSAQHDIANFLIPDLVCESILYRD